MTIDQESINEFLYGLYQDAALGSVSIKCRKKYNNYDQSSFVYGDSSLSSLHEILSKVEPKEGDVFYDLGSGGGRVVLFSAMSFPFAKCVGIELLDELVEVAESKLELARQKLPNLPFDVNKLSGVQLIQGDFIEANLRDANVVYAASTCFEGKLMQVLAETLEDQVAVGTRIITCTKSLPGSSFKVLESKLYPMEWGSVTVFFQERV